MAAIKIPGGSVSVRDRHYGRSKRTVASPDERQSQAEGIAEKRPTIKGNPTLETLKRDEGRYADRLATLREKEKNGHKLQRHEMRALQVMLQRLGLIRAEIRKREGKQHSAKSGSQSVKARSYFEENDVERIRKFGLLDEKSGPCNQRKYSP